MQCALKTVGEHKNLLDDEVQVLTITQEIFGCAPKTEMNDFELIEEHVGAFFSFMREV